MSENLPALQDHVSDTGNGLAVVSALQNLVSNLHDRAERFDDVSVNLHSETSPDGSTRSTFSYRCVKRTR